MIEAASGRHTDESSAVLNATKVMGSAMVQSLLEALNNNRNIRIEYVRILYVIGDTRAVEPLIKMLNDKESDVLRGSTWALPARTQPSVLVKFSSRSSTKRSLTA